MAGLVVVPAAIYYLFILQDRSSGFFSFWTLRLGKMVFTSFVLCRLAGDGWRVDGSDYFYGCPGGGIPGPRPAQAALDRILDRVCSFWAVLPFQYTTHEYYHLGLVPLVALSIMPLLEVIFQQMAQQPRLWRWLAIGVLLFYAGYSLYVARSQMYRTEL